MKKFIRIFAFILAMVFVLALFTACEQKTEKKQELKVATNAEFPPFETLDDDGNVIGFDADLIEAIAESLDMTVKYDNMEFDGVLAAIASKTCDVAISGLTINEKRKKSVNFSDPYYEGAAQVLIVRSDDTIYTGTTKEELDEQLKNQKIGVCSGFTGKDYAMGDEEWGFEGIEGADVKIYDNISLAIQDLKNNNITAIIMDDVPAKEAAAKDENKDAIKVIDIPLTVEEYGIAVNKDDEELLKQINTALKVIKSSGKYEQLLEKWGLK